MKTSTILLLAAISICISLTSCDRRSSIAQNKKEAIEMLLKDQYPISTDKEITIELLDNGKAKVNPETGILTWDVKLGAGETKKFRISYKIKYPKDKFIDNL